MLDKQKVEAENARFVKDLRRAHRQIELFKNKDEKVVQLKKELAAEKIARLNQPSVRDAKK